MTERSYHEDSDTWSPADYYALFRYLNRLFLNQRGLRSREIASIDLARMSAETKHLLKHVLIQGPPQCAPPMSHQRPETPHLFRIFINSR